MTEKPEKLGEQGESETEARGLESFAGCSAPAKGSSGLGQQPPSFSTCYYGDPTQSQGFRYQPY